MQQLAVRLLIVVATLVVPGCSRQGEIHVVVVDSTTTAGVVEVLALPFDPLVRTTTTPRSGVNPLADSIASLDAAFQSLRTSINRDAAALDTSDRHAARYAARFDSLQSRIADAERLRGARDRLRRIAPVPAAPTVERPSPFAQTALDSAARASGRAIVHMQAATASMRVDPGAWWLVAMSPDRSRRSAPVPLAVRRGDVDTVRLVLR